MAKSTTPTQIGFNPVSSNNGSRLIFGQDTTVSFEAVGLGSKGRPDVLQTLIINISKNNGDGTYNSLGKISFDIADILDIVSNNPNVPTANGQPNISLTLTEVAVCATDNDGNAKEQRMIILGSPTYDPPASSVS